jgi:hypothetical protein
MYFLTREAENPWDHAPFSSGVPGGAVPDDAELTCAKDRKPVITAENITQ